MGRGVARWGVAAVAAMMLLTGGGCARVDGSAAEVPAPVALPGELPDGSEETSGSPVPEEVSATPSAVESMGAAPKATPTASASPSAAERSPKPKRTTATAPRTVPKPPTEKQVPPDPPKPPASDCKPSYKGDQASRAQAKAALTEAAGRTYWPTSAPDIRIPLNLIKATAWQESGWQSNIVACDKGIGLMQVMPDTASWMNQRFGQSYDVWDYRDNAYLGGTFLAWLTKYIGDMYFDADYRLDADLCTAELDSCLLNAVIAAYNYGHGAVAPEGKPLHIPNPSYVRNVRALMSECVCLGF
ncbi:MULTISPECIES: transglycosylase SLT domain-containing protein [unclassified Micromonospora]|uniref:transglycosylase SLT domain-containing protein n=1 Tax=unclassified Micromonospora TaxID=2617518 RepID=UPI0022B65CA5|nr:MULTISPECIES: transglycosylase SLT domain-containing protein [unclassified Micromonospora]MCZ7424000.1 transglycosylase SLT domain-containing protein [Verrucosispora sp. WMMA2121]WBB91747.1 transglycosylase SLT domain-containing protein [Verrucosispora sp. WMMC514]